MAEKYFSRRFTALRRAIKKHILLPYRAVFFGLIIAIIAIIFVILNNQPNTSTANDSPTAVNVAGSSIVGGSSTLSQNSSTATINVNGQQTTLNNPTDYSQTTDSNGATINVSIHDHQSSSGSSSINKSSDSITVNTSN